MDVVTLALAKKGAKSYTDTVINNLPKGVVYRGSVNYYADLPNTAELGDCYTVIYKGATGTESSGAEYVWGLNTATNIREWIKIGEEIDLSEYATENWVNEQISDFLPDAETYKTAELTEGQITDVIGVSDIKIKGQTSQAGEPTPDSPVDVNVVSGSNVINIYNGQTLSKELPLDLPVENLFDENNYVAGQVYSNNTITANTPWGIFYLPCTSGETYIISGLKTYSNTQIVQCNSNKQFILNLVTRNTEDTEYTITATQNGYIGISFVWSASASKGSEIDTINIKKAGIDPIELCKIGKYQDYFYKSGSKWYLHKRIKKRVFNGSESWATAKNTSPYVYNLYIADYLRVEENIIIDTHFQSVINGTYGSMTDGQIKFRYYSDTSNLLYICTTVAQTLADFKTWLSNNNVTIYYVLKEPIITEITDTTLINQLEAIYNAPLYKQTNITQTNNDLPMVLDITACKDNINGIKAFIRNSVQASLDKANNALPASKMVTLTQAQYDVLETKDSDTYYHILEEE